MRHTHADDRLSRIERRKCTSRLMLLKNSALQMVLEKSTRMCSREKNVTSRKVVATVKTVLGRLYEDHVRRSS